MNVLTNGVVCHLLYFSKNFNILGHSYKLQYNMVFFLVICKVSFVRTVQHNYGF